MFRYGAAPAPDSSPPCREAPAHHRRASAWVSPTFRPAARVACPAHTGDRCSSRCRSACASTPCGTIRETPTAPTTDPPPSYLTTSTPAAWETVLSARRSNLWLVYLDR